MRHKETIAIDIDDVIAANAQGFVKFSNERWGTNLTVDDYDEHWAKVWDVDEVETARRAIELHESGAIGSYTPLPRAEVILRHLHENYNIIAVTSRRLLIESETHVWLATHFAGVIDDVHFAGFYDDITKIPHGRTQTKKDILLEIGAKYFIDDQLKHCLAAAEAGINVVLFGDYSWNQLSTLPSQMTRCSTWEGVATYFDGRKNDRSVHKKVEQEVA